MIVRRVHTATHSSHRLAEGSSGTLAAYEIEKDAARAYDKVASVLGRPLNFPNSEPVKIVGQRTEGADESVADAVEAAKSFVASGGNKKSSIYTGVSEIKGRGGHRWKSQIKVGQGSGEALIIRDTHTSIWLLVIDW